jgi:hypothetical protein
MDLGQYARRIQRHWQIHNVDHDLVLGALDPYQLLQSQSNLKIIYHPQIPTSLHYL